MADPAMLYFKSCYVNGRTNEFESVNVFTAEGAIFVAD
jgi:hypothetical protein